LARQDARVIPITCYYVIDTGKRARKLGAVIPIPPQDMNELARSFEGYLRVERGRSPMTIKRYLSTLTKFAAYIDAENADLVLEKVVKADLVKFLRQSAGDGNEPSRTTWNLALASLRSFYEYLFKTEVINVNPAMRIDRLKTNLREPTPLSLDEYLALVEAAEQLSAKPVRSRNAVIIHVLFHSSLRVREVCSLNLDHLDFDNRWFSNIRTKGSKWLSLPFSDLVSAALERYLNDRTHLAANKKNGEPELALFLSTRGTRLSIRAIEEMVTNCAQQAGISRSVGPHLVRHSGATGMSELGTPLSVVQEILGHASVSTTRRYVHVRDVARRNAVDSLGKEVTKRLRDRTRRPSRRSTSTPDVGFNEQ